MTSSYLLRLAVTVMISVGTLSLFIAICTNQWVHGNGRRGVLYVGLWKYCGTDACVTHSFIIYAKVLLVITVIYGVIITIVAIVAQVANVADIKKPLAKLALSAGFCGLCGVILTTVFVVHDTYFKSVAFGLIFGWIGPTLHIIAGIVSWIHHKKEPDNDITIDDLKRLGSVRSTQPPPYTAEPPPGTIIVS